MYIYIYIYIHCIIGQYKMQTADCRLGIKCRLQTGYKMQTEYRTGGGGDVDDEYND